MRTISFCGKGRCCPELHVSSDKKTVSITDDYGEIVTMKYEQFRAMQRVVL